MSFFIYFSNRQLFKALGHINVDSAWNIETGKRYIKVGVFDSGIDTTHPDLKILTGRGYNYNPDTDSTSWGTDQQGFHGHGTLVAGIIGAKRNNGIGVAGIAGGDGSDTSGVSLIDFRLSPTFNGENISKAIIDASRSVGSYYDWSTQASTPNTEYYWSHAGGYGIHLANHSYYIDVENFSQIDTLGGKDLSDSTNTDDPINPPPLDCMLCREAFLFSMKNGVINVCASGNGILPVSESPLLYAPQTWFPQNYDDSWVVQVGGSGTDGEWFGGSNGAPYENHFFARANLKIDVAAPFTNVLVYSTCSKQAFDTVHQYTSFSGTSAASPHAAGVVALLLSRYNQNCYANSNLDLADVEYILEHSARDTFHSDYTGYGLINSYRALKMIDFPEYQIVHPELNPATITEIANDTITLFLNRPFFTEAKGPIGSNFPLALRSFYNVERHEYEITYDFSDYTLPSTHILDVWTRPSATNSLSYLNDTAYVPDPSNPSNLLFVNDTFQVEPKTEIINVSSGSVTLKGYYYHFIGKHLSDDDAESPTEPSDYWYPINPNETNPKMAFSIYIRDSLALFYSFACDSLNHMVDSNLSVNSISSTGEIKLYPNPGNYLTVSSPTFIHSITFYRSDGQVIYNELMKEEEQNFIKSMDCSILASGVYFVQITDFSGAVITKKWIKL